MKSPRKNDRGSVLVIELIVLAMVLTVAGIAVLRYYEHKKTVNPAVSPVPHAANATPTPSPSTPPANVLQIKELGFKITVPDGLRGLKYATRLNLRWDVDGREYVVDVATFSTDSLEQADSASTCRAGSGPLGTIAKYPLDPTGKVQGTPDMKKVGEFYLTYTAPQAHCSLSEATTKLQTAQFNLLREAFNSAIAVP
jgi:hypothetical protein